MGFDGRSASEEDLVFGKFIFYLTCWIKSIIYNYAHSINDHINGP